MITLDYNKAARESSLTHIILLPSVDFILYHYNMKAGYRVDSLRGAFRKGTCLWMNVVGGSHFK